MRAHLRRISRHRWRRARRDVILVCDEARAFVIQFRQIAESAAVGGDVVFRAGARSAGSRCFVFAKRRHSRPTASDVAMR